MSFQGYFSAPLRQTVFHSAATPSTQDPASTLGGPVHQLRSFRPFHRQNAAQDPVPDLPAEGRANGGETDCTGLPRQGECRGSGTPAARRRHASSATCPGAVPWGKGRAPVNQVREYGHSRRMEWRWERPIRRYSEVNPVESGPGKEGTLLLLDIPREFKVSYDPSLATLYVNELTSSMPFDFLAAKRGYLDHLHGKTKSSKTGLVPWDSLSFSIF